MSFFKEGSLARVEKWNQKKTLNNFFQGFFYSTKKNHSLENTSSDSIVMYEHFTASVLFEGSPNAK
jgi:hypothetical protein